MATEGGRDRPGNNSRQNLLMESNWNERTGRACKKVKYINKTGAASVYGSLVKFSTTTDYGVVLTGANDDEAIGAVYEASIADGSEMWIVVGGSAHVLLKNGTSATAGNWAETANVAGRADCTNAAPVPATHWDEIGHCCESKTSGTDVLAEILMHFN